VLKKQTNGSYEYTVDSNGDGFLNTSGLSFRLTRSTGLFKGTFKAWYDYTSTVDHTTNIDRQTHTSKSITYQGVLTPGRKNTSDSIEGRGFSLLQDKGSYDSRRTDQYGAPLMSTYSFNWSYDFLLLKPPQ